MKTSINYIIIFHKNKPQRTLENIYLGTLILIIIDTGIIFQFAFYDNASLFSKFIFEKSNSSQSSNTHNPIYLALGIPWLTVPADWLQIYQSIYISGPVPLCNSLKGVAMTIVNITSDLQGHFLAFSTTPLKGHCRASLEHHLQGLLTNIPTENKISMVIII